ncbi:MAG: hypothetical protein ACYC2H_01180 [Thermoplasmatota archaeon]
MRFTIRRGPVYYRRGPVPYWVQYRPHATGFATEKAAWDEAEQHGLDFNELDIEADHTRETP